MKVCAVTGASSRAGSAICAELEQAGWQVVRFGRRPGDIPFRLGDDVSPDLFRSRRVSALVHCAYDFSLIRSTEIDRVNVQGARKLLTAARGGGVSSIVVLSTTAAFPGCRSQYGRAKLQIEEEAAGPGTWVIRPGLLWGEALGGIVRKMDGLMARLPVVPLISGRRPFFCCHVDDLALFVRRALEATGLVPQDVLVAACPEPLPFAEVLRRVAARRHRTPHFLPVPWQLAWAGLKLTETAGLRIGFRSDSVVSLVHQNVRPDFGPGQALRVTFRPLQ